ncbi:ATP-binding protein, partial [Mesorhizobium sp. M0060]|uniref:GAF domain-containing sensor histidine kinase n=1 Tax=Mesorhizobium sp. M0060 TaxID=2956866 RepID=UPI00333A40A7
CRVFLRRAFDAAQNAGDLTYAAYSCIDVITNRFASGDPLGEVEREAENGLEFAQKVRFGLAGDCITGQLRLVRMLRGLTPEFTSFNDAEFDEGRFEQRLENNPGLAIGACWYWIRKLQACVYAGDGTSAVAAASKVAPLLWTAPTQFELAEYHFYGALARAARCDTTSAEERQQHLEALVAHDKQIALWAKNCSETFANRAALIGAEIARLEGRELDAMRLYEEAIRLAREHGFIQNEGLAHELAARFCTARGLETIAHAYLRNARYCYLQWGALGKVKQLEERYPHLQEERVPTSRAATIGTPVAQMDVETAIKASQAVSGEIVLENLIKTLMVIAVEHAGAERGLLILPRGDQLWVEAEAITGREDVTVRLLNGAHTTAGLPDSLVRYVMRTQETVILDDVSSQNPFSADLYIVQRPSRSILCLPLINQAKLIGILYLENNLTRYVFTPDRVTVLKVIASQAAISLVNSRLYRDLEDREGKIRRLVDSNIIGVFVGDFDGRILETNDAFLRIVGYDREDLAAGRINWKDLTPPDWRERDAQWIEEHKRTGVRLPIEQEYFRKDGSRVPILLGSATFQEGGNQSVAFVLDLTERRRAEEALRELESDLAHMSRLSVMGELTASLAHEIMHPIAASRNNALAALNFLGKQPPDLDEVRDALHSIVGDADRAGDIVDRIRDHIKKAPPRKSRFDLNAAINEVLVLTRSAFAKNRVSVQTRLTDALFPVEGDRVQLQQVVLNLILNAVEAMSTVEAGPRELSISTEQTQAGGVLVSVRDSGPGIDPDHIERVFDAFYTTKSSGVGMGLSISRSIIKAHGGRLWADMNASHGAVLRFSLPGAGKELTTSRRSADRTG